MAAATFLTILASLVAAISVGIYFFGIPPEIKRKLERQALKTMGENKMSYVAKSTFIPLITTTYLLTPPQVKLTSSQLPTKKTSSSSRRASAISWAALSTTHWARHLVNSRTV